MGNSSSNAGNNNGGGGTTGGGGTKPPADSLTFETKSPTNTSVFTIYNQYNIDYIGKVLKSLVVLPIINSYTIFIPGYEIAFSKNKTKFSQYSFNLDYCNDKYTNPPNDSAKVLTITTDSLTATITESKTLCTIISSLPSVKIETIKKYLIFSRSDTDMSMPDLLIGFNEITDSSTEYYDCYIKTWSEAFVPTKCPIGNFLKSRLFTEDKDPLPMYTFILDKFNINRNYSDYKNYIVTPKSNTDSVILTHMNTMLYQKNTCPIYIFDYYSGQRKLLFEKFSNYFTTSSGVKITEFYANCGNVSNGKPVNSKCWAFGLNSRNNDILNFKNFTIDLSGNTKSNFSYDIKTNKVSPNSIIFGQQWATIYTDRAALDYPTEVFTQPDNLKINPSKSFLFYYLDSDQSDFYMVAQLVNNAVANKNKDTDFVEKYAVLFNHNDYDNDSQFKALVDSVKYLRVSKVGNKRYALTNCPKLDFQTNGAGTSIFPNTYFSVDLGDNPNANKVNNTVVVDPNTGKMDTFASYETTRTNFLGVNPVTAKAGLYFSQQLVRVSDDLRNSSVYTYYLIGKSTNTQTVYNFLRQCQFKDYFQNFVYICDTPMTDVTIVPGYKVLKSDNIYMIYPDKFTSMSVVTDAQINNFKYEFDNYAVYIAVDTQQANDPSVTKPKEPLLITFKPGGADYVYQTDIPIGYKIKENSFNISLNEQVYVGFPLGILTFQINLNYLDRIQVVDKNQLLNTSMYTLVVENIQNNSMKALVNFADQEFKLNSKTSKFNLILLPQDKTTDFESTVAKRDTKNNIYVYSFDEVTPLLEEDRIALTSKNYGEIDFSIEGKAIKTVDEMFTKVGLDTPVYLNKNVKSLYTLLRQDNEITKTSILSLKFDRQIQFRQTPFDVTNVITSESKSNDVPSFNITSPGVLTLSVIRAELQYISYFMKLLISTKELTQQTDEFVIVVSFEEDAYCDIQNLLAIFRKICPCTVDYMDNQKCIVITNTKVNYDPDKIHTKSHTIEFLKMNSQELATHINDSDKIVQIVNRETIVVHKGYVTNAVLNSGKQTTFQQYRTVSVTNDFDIVEREGRDNRWPIVNFLVVNYMEQNELLNLAEAYRNIKMDKNLVVLNYNTIDYPNIEGVTVRKHMTVLTPITYGDTVINYKNANYYEINIDDSKSSVNRRIQICFLPPACKLSAKEIRALINEKTFVIHANSDKTVGIEYSKEMNVLINDTCDITYNMYGFDYLKNINTPKLEQWVNTTNKYITYLRPIDRYVLDGSNYITDFKIILNVVILSPDIVPYELMNLIAHLFNGAKKSCEGVIFRVRSKSPYEFPKFNLNLAHFVIRNEQFSNFKYNYLYHPSKNFVLEQSDSKTVKLFDKYIYYDDQNAPPGNNAFYCKANESRVVAPSDFEVKIDKDTYYYGKSAYNIDIMISPLKI